MKKVLFAFIFAILGIGVGTVFSKPISKVVDYFFAGAKSAGKGTQKIIASQAKKAQETAKTSEEKKDETPAKDEKKEEKIALENPFAAAESKPEEKAKLDNPFTTTTPPAPSPEPIAKPEEKTTLANPFATQTPQKDQANEAAKGDGPEVLGTTPDGLDILGDDIGCWTEDPKTGDIVDDPYIDEKLDCF